MRVAVIGGTGSIGRLVVDRLAADGEDVRVLSRTAPAELPAGAGHRSVDLRSGAGLDDALDGVDAVVDVANGRKHARELLVDGTRRTIEAGAAAGVAHHLLVSIVGCNRVPIDYYAAKVAQEQILAEGAVPWSLLRATQFHTLIDGAFTAAARFKVIPRVAVPVQPIDPEIVAARIVAALRQGPGHRLPDIAGPRIEDARELARVWSRTTGRRGLPLRLPGIGETMAVLRDGALCDVSAATEGPTFEEWLRAR